MIKFRSHCKRVEKQAGLAHTIESARSREIQLANRALQLRNIKLEKRHQTLAAIPTVNYSAMHPKLSALRHPGTNKRIPETTQFVAWNASKTSDCLCCYGIPGSGKSVLAASVVNDLLGDTTNFSPNVLYYYCDFTEDASLDTSFIVSSLTHEVLVRAPLDKFSDQLRCPYQESYPIPQLSKALVFLKALLQDFRRVTVIMDGIDQLALDSQSVVLSFMDDLRSDSSFTTKVLITSRSEEYFIKRTLKAHKIIHLYNDNTQDDIALFVERYLNSSLAKQNTLLENARLKQEVVQALLSGANGM
jgi:Cdc6-like AAA superfamily ATPase